MKKYHILYIMLLMMTFIGLSSCSENSNTVEEYPNWKATNESEFNSVYAEAVKYIASGNDSWKVIKKWSYQDSIHNNPEDYIVAQVITKGTALLVLFTQTLYAYIMKVVCYLLQVILRDTYSTRVGVQMSMMHQQTYLLSLQSAV